MDELAWEEFVRRFHNVIKSTVGKTFRRRVRDETDRQEQFRDDATEDLIQTVYHRLLEDRSAALRRFGGAHDNSIYQYLMMISINVVRDYFREAKAQKRPRVSHSLDDVLSRETAGTVCSEVAGHIGRLPSGDHNQVTMDEIESALQRSVGLRNRSRDMMIFKLHYVDGLTLDEIAGVVGPGLSRVGINSILNRITRKMRVLLSTYSRKP